MDVGIYGCMYQPDTHMRERKGRKKLITAKLGVQTNGIRSKRCSLRGIAIASADGLLGECV